MLWVQRAERLLRAMCASAPETEGLLHAVGAARRAGVA
jgi:hypothetical protein